MEEKEKKDRYANVPISEHTRKGMSINSDDIQAIARLLSIQDEVYDEQFEDIKKALVVQKEASEALLEGLKLMNKAIANLEVEVKNVQKEVQGIKVDIDNLKQDVSKVTVTVDCTKSELDELIVEVKKLKHINSWPMIALRVGVAVGIALILVKFIYF